MFSKTGFVRLIDRIILSAPGGRQALDLYSALKLVKRSDIADRIRWARREDRRMARPVPGMLRMISVAGTPSIDWFLESGAAAVACLRQALARHGRELGKCEAILDFGCGCGRVLRHLEPLAARTGICGVDINGASIAWSRKNLPFAATKVCPLAPPLAYADGSFDLIYALSVFTHLPENLQLAWMGEMARLLRPGGLLFFTAHGVSYAADLQEAERKEFEAGRLVVRRAATAGSNWCGAYHPRAWVENHLLNGFRLLEHSPEGALGNPHQDFYLLEKI